MKEYFILNQKGNSFGIWVSKNLVRIRRRALTIELRREDNGVRLRTFAGVNERPIRDELVKK